MSLLSTTSNVWEGLDEGEQIEIGHGVAELGENSSHKAQTI